MINYMVDSENVGTKWIPYLKENIKKSDRVFSVSYTHLNWRVKTRKKRSFIKTELRCLQTKTNTYYINPST